jgi:hypothetical protein
MCLLTGGGQNLTLGRGHITSTITTMCQDMQAVTLILDLVAEESEYLSHYSY